MRGIVITLLVAAVVAAAVGLGIVFLSGGPPEGVITVIGARGVDVNCLEYSVEEECHNLEVRFHNPSGSELSTWKAYWEAVGTRGDVYASPFVRGIDRVLPGEEGSLVLQFDVVPGDKLRTLRYLGYRDWKTLRTTIEVSVPAYTIAAWDPGVRFAVAEVEVITSRHCGRPLLQEPELECHRISLRITNRGEYEFQIVGGLTWWWAKTLKEDFVKDESGDRLLPIIDGPIHVGPGATDTVTLSWTVAAGSRIGTIVYADVKDIIIPVGPY